VDFIISMLRMLQVRTLLDVGTASGRTLRNLKSAIPELRICGLEPVGALLDQASLAAVRPAAPSFKVKVRRCHSPTKASTPFVNSLLSTTCLTRLRSSAKCSG
jgi:hypothetical protein